MDPFLDGELLRDFFNSIVKEAETAYETNASHPTSNPHRRVAHLRSLRMRLGHSLKYLPNTTDDRSKISAIQDCIGSLLNYLIDCLQVGRIRVVNNFNSDSMFNNLRPLRTNQQVMDGTTICD